MRWARWRATGLAGAASAALQLGCAATKTAQPAPARPAVVGVMTPAQVLGAMRSSTHAVVASGSLATPVPQAALLVIAPRAATVWLGEPYALVKVTATIAPVGPDAVATSLPDWSTTTAVHVAAHMLGKFAGAITAQVVPVDGGVVLVPLARFVDANAAPEAIGIVASLLGHRVDASRMVLGTLHRDGTLAAARPSLNLASLPPQITAVAVARGSQWRLGGRALDVVEVGDVYQAYAFLTSQPLPGVEMPLAGPPQAFAPDMLAQLAPMWADVLVAAHDHGLPDIREVAQRCLAAARASAWARQQGALDDASRWLREALILARALQTLTAAPAEPGLPRSRSAARAIESVRSETMAEALTPAQLAEATALRGQLTRLRWGTPPPHYPGVGAPPTGIAARMGLLRLLGATPADTLFRWWHEAAGLLAMAAPPGPSDQTALRALHAAAAHRLYEIAMLLDAQLAARAVELSQASTSAHPSP